MLGKIVEINNQDLLIRGLNGEIYTCRGANKSRQDLKTGLWASFSAFKSGQNPFGKEVRFITPNRYNIEKNLKRISSEWNVEARKELNKYFYVRDDYESVVEGRHTLILGRKGSGKTALAKYIRKKCAQQLKLKPIEISFESDLNAAVFSTMSSFTKSNSGLLAGFESYQRIDLYKTIWESYVLPKVAVGVFQATKDSHLKKVLEESGFSTEHYSDNASYTKIIKLMQKAFGVIPKAGLKIAGGALGAAIAAPIGAGPIGAVIGTAAVETFGEKVGEAIGEHALKDSDSRGTDEVGTADIFSQNNKIKFAIKRAIDDSKSIQLPLYVIFDELDYLYNEADGRVYFEIIFSLLKLVESMSEEFSFEDLIVDKVDRFVIPLVFLRDDIFNSLQKNLNITSDIHKLHEGAFQLDWNWGSLNRLMAFRLWAASQSDSDASYNEEMTSFDQQWLNYFNEVIPLAFKPPLNSQCDDSDGNEDDGGGISFKAGSARSKEKDQSILTQIYESSTRVPRDYILAVKFAASMAADSKKKAIDEEIFIHSQAKYSYSFYLQLKGELGGELKNFEGVIAAIKRSVKEKKSDKFKYNYEDFSLILINSGLAQSQGEAERIATILYNYSVISNVVQDAASRKERYFPTYAPGGEFSASREIIIHRGLWRYLEA